MKKKILQGFLLFFLLVMGTINSEVFANEKIPEVHFIDVGQSDCILIKSGKKNYLLDTGWGYYSSRVISYLQYNNIYKIDGIILTHYHDDHYGGMDMMLKTMKVNKVYLPKHEAKDKQKVINSINKNKVKIVWIKKGWKLKARGVYLEAIGPINNNLKNENNNSIVLQGKVDNVNYLFAGDCEKAEEKDMITEGLLKKCEVLKVPHHGFNTGTSDEFLDAIKPSVAIITSDGMYSPQDKLLHRLKNRNIDIFTTKDYGNLIIKNKKIKSTKMIKSILKNYDIKNR